MRLIGIILLIGVCGCDNRSSQPPASQAMATNSTTAPAGMSKYQYLAADGGPHMLLPAGVAGAWNGVSSVFAALNPNSDYGRACSATANVQMALVPVGAASAIVLADPPMTAWGKSSDGLIEIYYLASWTGMDLDALISKATAALPTASLTNTGKVIQLSTPDAFLLFAGDTPTRSAYGVHRISIPAGNYQILTGAYLHAGESVTIYRLKPTP